MKSLRLNILQVFMLLFCATVFIGCEDDKSNYKNNLNSEIDQSKISSESKILIETDYADYEINYGVNSNDFSFIKNKDLTINWEWSEDNPLTIRESKPHEDALLVLESKNENMTFNYKIESYELISNDSIEFTQLMADGSKNTISVKTPFELPNNFEYSQILGDHVLKNEYVNSKITQKCPWCWVIAVALSVVSDSDEREDDNCAENNRAVERNCMNRRDKCLENHGPCDLRCVKCADSAE
ncbi:MAG: hypothetical protein ABR595_01430 [Psychroflexus sp.]